jgi:hypothetical protein
MRTVRARARAGAVLGAAGLCLTFAATAWGAWGTISQQAYQGGIVCRDGMTFQWGDFTSTLDQVPPPNPQVIGTRLAVAFAQPSAGQPQLPPGTPVPSGSVAYDESIHADYKPEIVTLGGSSSQVYLIHQGRYQINWKAPRNAGDTVRLIFSYPDPQNVVVDIGGSTSSLVVVQDCLVPRVKSSKTTIDSASATPITVSLLGNAKFNVTQVDLSTIRAGGPDDFAAPLAPVKLKDVNGDGIKDAVGRYRPSDMHLLCGGNRLYVIGTTTAGVEITARADVKIKPC